jgi:hypothetical protein
MVIAIYTVLLLTCSFTLCVFGFFVGRCARKLPILDDKLPWTVHRGQIPTGECCGRPRPNAELPAVPGTRHGVRQLTSDTKRSSNRRHEDCTRGWRIQDSLDPPVTCMQKVPLEFWTARSSNSLTVPAQEHFSCQPRGQTAARD